MNQSHGVAELRDGRIFTAYVAAVAEHGIEAFDKVFAAIVAAVPNAHPREIAVAAERVIERSEREIELFETWAANRRGEKWPEVNVTWANFIWEAAARQWEAIRREAGRRIDPATADTIWQYRQTLDPYGVYPPLPEEYQQVGREYFARAPGSEMWVSFGDLTDATRVALWNRDKSKLAFPAGLDFAR